MQYTDPDGTTFELPKLTLALREEKQRAAQLGEEGAKLRAQYAWLKKVLPSDYLAQAVDGKGVESCDTTMLGVLFIRVSDTYDAPLTDAQMAQIEKQAAAFEKMGKVIDSATKINALNLNPGRQVFKAIK